MKFLFCLIHFCTLSYYCFAQIDVDRMQGLSPEVIMDFLGPTADCEKEWMDVDGEVILAQATIKYNNTIFIIEEGENKTFSLSFFLSQSPEFSILSEIVPGGIRVGDQFNKFRDIDFINTEKGRGNPNNALKSPSVSQVMIFRSRDDYDLSNYVIYEAEYYSYFLYVQNGTVKAIALNSKHDWNPEE